MCCIIYGYASTSSSSHSRQQPGRLTVSCCCCCCSQRHTNSERKKVNFNHFTIFTFVYVCASYNVFLLCAYKYSMMKNGGVACLIHLSLSLCVCVCVCYRVFQVDSKPQKHHVADLLLWAHIKRVHLVKTKIEKLFRRRRRWILFPFVCNANHIFHKSSDKISDDYRMYLSFYVFIN